MNKGAYYVHQRLKDELIDYLKSQYFRQTEVLLNACTEQMETPGILWSQPYIESSPAYESVPDGIRSANIPENIREFLLTLSQKGLGVFPTPFKHQVEALEAFCTGRDLFVSTGTGSGKTECFMWPLVSRLAAEAASSTGWQERGIRVIVMYPMNALVTDQIGRLRKMIGDNRGDFTSAFSKLSTRHLRRPQFGMYTGRTPYPGAQQDHAQDNQLANSLEKLLPNPNNPAYYEQLKKTGKIPAKADLASYIEQIRAGQHFTSPDDAEMITRFEMQHCCPDILITNYSMLEYMLLRQREDSIWDTTKEHFHNHPDEKLLFIIDEAHMYHGASGGEVSLLIRRLMSRLGLDRDRFQFILTTASMPHSTDEDRNSVASFASALTSSSDSSSFVFLYGHQAERDSGISIDIPCELLASIDLERMEISEEARLDELNKFIVSIDSSATPMHDMETVSLWLNDHLLMYKPFQILLSNCRGNAVALDELANIIYPNQELALAALDAMLTIAPFAHDKSGNVLFPARMHMLFRGFNGVYACVNPNCPNHHEGNGLHLGSVFLNDRHYVCPDCHSRVYELYTDRRCGALFLHGFVNSTNSRQFLWQNKGAFYDDGQMKEMHFYLPMDNDHIENSKGSSSKTYRCWLDMQNGYITFNDSDCDLPGFRELWYSIPAKQRKDNPDLLTFGSCPKCKSNFSHTRIQGFSTRGNEPFYNIIQNQFQLQPAASAAKEKDESLPNDGRKVLLFSDSRQKAARLARDMSISSDTMAVRKLFMLALRQLTDTKEQTDEDPILDDIYTYIVKEAASQNLDLFSNESRSSFKDAVNKYKRMANMQNSRRRNSILRMSLSDAPAEMLEHFLRMFCMPYNTLIDTGMCYFEPEYETMLQAMDLLKEKGIEVTEDEFTEFFSAITRDLMVNHVAFCHYIRDELRSNVIPKYGSEDYGVANFDKLPGVLADILGCKNDDQQQHAWMDAIKLFMLQGTDNNRRYFLNPSALCIVFYPEGKHEWYRCTRCAKVSPFLLKKHCQFCGSSYIEPVKNFDPESFWRTGILRAMDGEPVRVIDTEEHTAQLGHKDQRENVWAQTEEYEMRFQDVIQNDEKPIDVLSSTTTMEVGIDIGSLVAVGLRNMPPMRENYQQRAGRAGRRGASLSTIVTYAEGGPHDSYYFANPAPMFRGEPRRPWLDVTSPKLILRHINLIILNRVVRNLGYNLDNYSALDFFGGEYSEIQDLILTITLDEEEQRFDPKYKPLFDSCRETLVEALDKVQEKVSLHPDVYGLNLPPQKQKSMLDTLYEEGIIPTYSFPKDVVSTYIEDEDGNILQQVERGLDIAISEYAPGRAIVVDKKTYVIGGLYVHSEGRYNFHQTSDFLHDPNYVKKLRKCTHCGWFGFDNEVIDDTCPFCKQQALDDIAPMVRPWGFSPRDNRSEAANTPEDYSTSSIPQYSTLPDESLLESIPGYEMIDKATRQDQRIILLNTGSDENGFTICADCGAIVPGNRSEPLRGRKRPGNVTIQTCNHYNTRQINLGYDFLTDMLVLTIRLPHDLIETETKDSLAWIKRAGTTAAEAMKKAASILLDIEFDEIQAGYRVREGEDESYIDVYLYDSLSSGAGYCAQAGSNTAELLEKTISLLRSCDCDSACQRCLKHYRNQMIQQDLDRFAALELLEFGRSRKIPDMLTPLEANEQLAPLDRLISGYGIAISTSKHDIIMSYQGKTRKIIVIPAMMKQQSTWKASGILALTKEALRDAKPFAVSIILKEFGI